MSISREEAWFLIGIAVGAFLTFVLQVVSQGL